MFEVRSFSPIVHESQRIIKGPPSRGTHPPNHTFLGLSTMSPYDSPACNIGVAFYTHSTFPKPWVLALSESPLFKGHVWCNVIETERTEQLERTLGLVRLVAGHL